MRNWRQFRVQSFSTQAVLALLNHSSAVRDPILDWIYQLQTKPESLLYKNYN
jgi:hypothetical protein